MTDDEIGAKQAPFCHTIMKGEVFSHAKKEYMDSAGHFAPAGHVLLRAHRDAVPAGGGRDDL
ncbi:MAG: hypothetical protein J1E43_02160 [Christensenellaceae bacterium]|nr:hypothetical protein [Christensenellaceae bacterium]